MNPLKDYYDKLNNFSDYKIAPYWKRVFSSVIDLIIILFLFYFVLNIAKYQFRFNKDSLMFLFFYIMFFQYFLYILFRRTIGDFILKIRPAFILVEVNKSVSFMERSFLKTTVYLPIGLALISIIVAFLMIIGLLLTFFNPVYRRNKVLPWDMFTRMIIIED